MAQRDLSPTSTASTRSDITVRTDKPTDTRAMSSASPSSSTPPTSLDDEASVLSEATKTEQVVEVYNGTPVQQAHEAAIGDANATPGTADSGVRRPARSSRKSVTTYNVQILAGTAIHTPTKYLEKHHKNVVHGDLDRIKKENITPAKKKTPKSRPTSADISDPVEQQLVAEAAQAARRRTSSRIPDLRKEVLRNLSGVTDAVASSISGGKALIQKGLRRSASDSRLKSASSASSSSLKRPHTAIGTDDGQQADQSAEDEKVYLKPKSKVWLKQGLYVGQHRDFDARLSESQNRARKRAKKGKENTILAFPMFACERLLNEDPRHVFRDYKLPFDVYNPLPRKVKVDGWVKLHKNRFIGDASSLWKRDKQDSSQCYCDPEDGCGEACHNRIMAYECDGTNCRLSADQCGNRPFAELKKRSKGNRYDYGVEVVHTEDRGYGVRAMRTFEPHQIIVEYAGEIITQQECERRMKQVYKKDKCYYLMSFDNKMIIDATRGTIARFVNHSCEPNCEMIKWTVSGEPRMALFAGSQGVMTGEELTYDYNFDPFSQKNIQVCRCGTASCRGVLGPKPKKPVEEKSLTSALITGTKRKIQDILSYGRGHPESNPSSPKKRKVHVGNAATTKAQNAFAQSEAAREQAEREADEHSRQIASRENRAIKRSVSEDASRRGRCAKSRTTKPTAVKITRHTTVSFKHRVPKKGALTAVKTSSSFHATSRSTPSAIRAKKRFQGAKRPSTPVQNRRAEESSSDEDCSPNITPASLRSASKKSMQISPVRRDVDRGRATRRTNTVTANTSRRSGLALTQEGTREDDNDRSYPSQDRSRSTRGR